MHLDEEPPAAPQRQRQALERLSGRDADGAVDTVLRRASLTLLWLGCAGVLLGLLLIAAETSVIAPLIYTLF